MKVICSTYSPRLVFALQLQNWQQVARHELEFEQLARVLARGLELERLARQVQERVQALVAVQERLARQVQERVQALVATSVQNSPHQQQQSLCRLKQFRLHLRESQSECQQQETELLCQLYLSRLQTMVRLRRQRRQLF